MSARVGAAAEKKTWFRGIFVVVFGNPGMKEHNTTVLDGLKDYPA